MLKCEKKHDGPGSDMLKREKDILFPPAMLGEQRGENPRGSEGKMHPLGGEPGEIPKKTIPPICQLLKKIYESKNLPRKQVRNLCVYSRPGDRVWLPTGQLLGA